MAIPFAYLAPVHLTKHGGATSTIAYVARDVIDDPRFEQPLDYSHLRADLAWEEVILPECCSPAFRDRDVLAFALDEAELRKVRTPLAERKRRPQVGLALVLALPPSCEVSVAEAAEILHRVALAARGSKAIPIHVAIHEGRINRHAHALFALRSVEPDGALGPKLRDFVVRHRRTGSRNEEGGVVEGIHWPDLTWEIHQAFFHELGIDLVVDPIAPEPGRHFSPFVFRNGKMDDSKTAQRIASGREKAYAVNVRAIEGSPTSLLETLLRGRSSLRIAELERLCAKFFDGKADQMANVERILRDENIITMTDAAGANRPRYATTRRLHRLMTRAAGLLDASADGQINVFSEGDEDSVISRISKCCGAVRSRDKPLILGMKLSDCDAASTALGNCDPIVGTIDMVMTGSQEERGRGRKRDLRLSPQRLVIVPRAELVDDRRLARLMIATNAVGSPLLLGHNQSYATGVVCRQLAAFVADCKLAEEAPSAEDRGSAKALRLLRAGLVQHAVNQIANSGALEFGSKPNYPEDPSVFVVCDDPERIATVCRTVRSSRVRAGTIGQPVAIATAGKMPSFSVGERIVVPKQAALTSKSGRIELARILAIDPVNATIEVAGSGGRRRISLEDGLSVRPAAALSIREARNLSPESKMVIEATDPRRLWSALLLVATRGPNARLYVNPNVAQSKAELIKAARRSLPGALPHHRAVRTDSDAEAGKIISDIESRFEVLPAITPVAKTAPRPIDLGDAVRRLLAEDRQARLGYEQLCQYVGPHNPDHAANTAQVLAMYHDSLTKTVIRFLAGIEPNRRNENNTTIPFDLPSELTELEPQRWDEGDVYYLRQNLRYMQLRAWRNSLRSSPNVPSEQDNTFGKRT